jgi:serine/threonine-protein kinase
VRALGAESVEGWLGRSTRRVVASGADVHRGLQSAFAMAFEAGQVLGGRFRLVSRIGEDALGEIWRATDRVPTSAVEIRTVTPKVPVSRNAIETFLGEMRTACALRHRASMRVIDVGQGWFATEALSGESLEDVLERRSKISPPAALHLIAELAEAVAEAHALGLLHRRIHPRSVILHVENEGAASVKLVDFGRERLLRSSSAPEATKESDVWALGVMLFRCITGQLPFATAADSATQADVDRILGERVRDPAALCIVRVCLRLAREERVTAEDLADRAQLAGGTQTGGWNDVETMTRREPEKIAPLFAPPAARRESNEPARPPPPYEGVLDALFARPKLAIALLLVVGGTVAGARHFTSARRPALPHVIADRAPAIVPKAPEVVVAPPKATNCVATPTPPVVTSATPVAAPPPKRAWKPPPAKKPIDDDNPYE